VSGTDSRDEYLEAVFKLASSEEGATVTRIARELGVRPASASQMIGRLEEAGAVVRETPGRARVTLTESGRREAIALVRRHRLSERFLTDYLDLPWDEVHDEACKLEHVLSEAVEASLATRLGRPLTCPHGRVIPYDEGATLGEGTRALADCRSGEVCTVSHVADETPEFLRYVAALGLFPEAAIQIRGVEPFDGPLTVEICGVRRPVGREVARKVFVR